MAFNLGRPLTIQSIGFKHDGFLLKISIDEGNSENAVKSTGTLSSTYVCSPEGEFSLFAYENVRI